MDMVETMKKIVRDSIQKMKPTSSKQNFPTLNK